MNKYKRCPWMLGIILTALIMVVPAAEAQITLSKVFTPNTIGLGSVSTITFTITNGTGSPVSDLTFT